MSKIYQTAKYDKFRAHEINRNVEKTNKLEQSMLKYGWIDAYPMHVVLDDGDPIIKDGHHRFHVAKKLGIPVKFVICGSDEISIHELESARNSWSLKDYLISFSRSGKFDYEYVLDYHEKTGFPIMVCISVCAGESAGSNNYTGKFKEGVYKIGKQNHADMLASVAEKLKRIGIEFYSNSSFLKALSKCLWVPEFDIGQFTKKSKSNKSEMIKQPNVDRYLEMIDYIYNKGSKKSQVIPLSFMANKTADERSRNIKR